jgi:hypothetical protein
MGFLLQCTQLTVFALTVAACTVPPDPAKANPYEDCSRLASSDAGPPPSCRGATVCSPFVREGNPKQDDFAGICTTTCRTDADCVPFLGRTVVCDKLSIGRQCTVPCETDADCGRGTYCVALDRANGQDEVKRCAP